MNTVASLARPGFIASFPVTIWYRRYSPDLYTFEWFTRIVLTLPLFATFWEYHPACHGNKIQTFFHTYDANLSDIDFEHKMALI